MFSQSIQTLLYIKVVKDASGGSVKDASIFDLRNRALIIAETDTIPVVNTDNRKKRVMRTTLDVGSDGESPEKKIGVWPGLTKN